MKDWKKVVGSIAPTIATALGGPLAGVATKFLADTVLGKDATEDELGEYIIGATPEQLASIKKADQDFKAKMRELDIDVERLAVDDRKSARELFKTNIWPQIVLSIVFVVGYFSLVGMLFSGVLELHDSMKDVANVLLGGITIGVPLILRFWFGGSLHDNEHMDRIYNSTPNK